MAKLRERMKAMFVREMHSTLALTLTQALYNFFKMYLWKRETDARGSFHKNTISTWQPSALACWVVLIFESVGIKFPVKSNSNCTFLLSFVFQHFA